MTPAPAATGASRAGAPVSLPAARVVLDTNVLLSLFVFTDSRYAPIRQALEQGRWRALTDERCLREFRRVIGRPQFGLDEAAQAAILEAYRRLAEMVPPATDDRPPLPPCKDPDDQKFLELARDGRADWLLTGDKALLRLARRQRLKGLFAIVTPEVAMAP